MNDLDQIEFVANVHELTVQSHDSVEYLEAIIANPNTDPVVVAALVQAQSCLRVQNVLLRALFEENQTLLERLAQFIARELERE